ncbi:MAG TPA: hypothetical protein VF764_09760, partial [Steroidobacteraceae bacterium]
MRAPPGLHLHYVSLAEYESARWPDVLGVVTFNGSKARKPPATGTAGIPIAHVSIPVLPAAGELCEVWRCGEPAESGEHERVRFRRSDEMLFGCIAIPETDSARASSDDNRHSPLQQATAQAYGQIFST